MKNGNGIEGRLVNIDRDLCVIPNVAIHMNREMNKGVEYNPQVDLLPLLADVSFDEYDAHTTYDAQTASENAEEQPETVEKPTLVALAAEAAGVDAETILGEDLFLYTRQEGKMIGAKGEFVLSPRLDDLQSAFALTKAFTESTPAEYINLCAVFDNEEVGNISKNGAFSRVTSTILKLIYEGLGCNELQYDKELLKSNIISVDAAHGFHPVFATHYDKEHMCILNRGFCIKQASSQAYATDSTMSGMIQQLCRKENIPFQKYMNHADIRGGGTLGSIISCVLGVKTADIGVPILSMHSSLETMGMEDENSLIHFLRIYYDAM